MFHPPTCFSVLVRRGHLLERKQEQSEGYFQRFDLGLVAASAAIHLTTRRTTSFTGTFGAEAFCQDIALDRSEAGFTNSRFSGQRDLHRYVQTAVLKVCKGSFAILAIYYLQKKTTIYMFIRRFIIFCNKSPPK